MRRFFITSLLFKLLLTHSLSVTMRSANLVICGPSGVGKGTIINKLIQRYSNKIALSVSHTTRRPRPGEINGVHYHFVSEEAMNIAIAQNMFLEHAQVHGNTYGTSYQAVEAISKSNRICLLDVDTRGVKSIKNIPTFQAKFVFIAPPSIQALEDRLRGRGTESDEQLALRLANSQAEIDYGHTEGIFDCILVNNEVDESVNVLCAKIDDWFKHVLG